MLKIVTINNDKEVETKIHDIINKGFMSYDFYYEYYSFNNDNKRLEQYLKEKHKPNVYIISDTNGNSKDILKKIRKQYKDHNSFIFIININNLNLKHTIEEEYPFNTKVINDKTSEYNSLLDCIKYIAQIHNSDDENTLTIKSKGNIRRIPYEEIYYIEKEANTKKSIIVSSTENVPVNKPLNDIKKKLNEDFIQTHRSAIVNKNNVKRINIKEKQIIFQNGIVCSLISRSYKKDFKKMILK